MQKETHLFWSQSKRSSTRRTRIVNLRSNSLKSWWKKVLRQELSTKKNNQHFDYACKIRLKNLFQSFGKDSVLSTILNHFSVFRKKFLTVESKFWSWNFWNRVLLMVSFLMKALTFSMMKGILLSYDTLKDTCETFRPCN